MWIASPNGEEQIVGSIFSAKLVGEIGICRAGKDSGKWSNGFTPVISTLPLPSNMGDWTCRLVGGVDGTFAILGGKGVERNKSGYGEYST